MENVEFMLWLIVAALCHRLEKTATALEGHRPFFVTGKRISWEWRRE